MIRIQASIAAALLAVTPAMAAPAPDQFCELCVGSETVRVGAQAPRRLTYQIALSIDLASRTYCYGACGKNQSYPLGAVTGSLIRLADVDVTGQSRRMTFDRETSRLTDVQHMAMGALMIDRDAQALCKPSQFHTPFRG